MHRGSAGYATHPSDRSRGACQMSNVVELDSTGGGGKRARAPRRKAAPARRRRRASKTALVLGGGGFTGGVYEIGALRALDLLTTNRSVNEFDVFVGTSAGSLIAALAANGVTPEQMMQVVNDQPPAPLRHVDLDLLLRPNVREFVVKGVKLPLHVLGTLGRLGRNLGSFSLVDLATAVADALPTGLYSGAGVEELRALGSRRSRPHRRLPPARLRALPRGHRPRHLRADRARRRRLGRRADLRPPCAPRRRCRWSTSRTWSRAASSWTAGSSPPPTSTSRSRRARG